MTFVSPGVRRTYRWHAVCAGQTDGVPCVSPGALEEDTEGRSKEELSETQRHQMKHRELFLSRQVETLPATHIRGKCAVTLLNETEALLSYLNKGVSSRPTHPMSSLPPSRICVDGWLYNLCCCDHTVLENESVIFTFFKTSTGYMEK